VHPPLGDGAGSPIDQGVSSFLFIAALFFGLVGVQRIRGRGFARLPRAAGWAAVGLAAASVVLALVIPQVIRPLVQTRPSSTATLRILSPSPGQVLEGDPAQVVVRLRLVGGRIVPFTTTRIEPNQGHVHLYLDGALVSMTLALTQRLSVSPGEHLLQAEFVAADHAPFDPRVITSVRFRVEAPAASPSA
jgi:hypothetical protein